MIPGKLVILILNMRQHPAIYIKKVFNKFLPRENTKSIIFSLYTIREVDFGNIPCFTQNSICIVYYKKSFRIDVFLSSPYSILPGRNPNLITIINCDLYIWSSNDPSWNKEFKCKNRSPLFYNVQFLYILCTYCVHNLLLFSYYYLLPD